MQQDVILHFALNNWVNFFSTPTTTHFNAACRVIKHLKTCPSRGIFFPRDSPIQLNGYSNADWGGCVDTKKSISSQCLFLGKSLISWRTKKQLTISRSSYEEEYRALASTTCELKWLLYLLHVLHVKCIRTPAIYCDNQSAFHIATNSIFHERIKHLEIDCHIAREKQSQGIMKLILVKSSQVRETHVWHMSRFFMSYTWN